ncbi:MAG: glycosyltransferase family 2 protein [Marmoricola sp.]
MLENQAALKREGILFPGAVWRDQVIAVRDLIDSQPPAPNGPWNRLVDEINAWPGTAIVSMEYLAPRMDKRIAMIQEAFANSDLQVVFTARDLARNVPAMWVESVQNRGVSTWEEFCQQVGRGRGSFTRAHSGHVVWKHQDIAAISRRWSRLVGREHFTLITVPQAGAAPTTLWQRFAEVAGITTKFENLKVSGNPSIGAASALVLRELNLRLADTDITKPEYHQQVKHALAKRGLARRATKGASFELDEDWVRARGERMVAQLRELNPRVVGDLDELIPVKVPGVAEVSVREQRDTAIDALAMVIGQWTKDRRVAGVAAQPTAAAAAPSFKQRLKNLIRPEGAAAPATASAAPSETKDRTRKPLDFNEPLRIAAITFCRNEAAFLPRWIDYYGAQFGVENIYVIDDNSDDGSTDNLPCDVLKVPAIRGGSFNTTRMAFVGNFGRALFELYDVVLFCDTDEFVVPDPAKYLSLRDYIEKQSRNPAIKAVGAFGLNVVHAVEAEGPLNPDEPLLGQRQVAKFLPLMCKPAIKWVTAHWSTGTHGVRVPYEVDPDLWMFHFKFGDRDLLQSAADHRAAMVAEDGRSENTSWRRGGDELVALIEEITAGVTDVSTIADFKPWEGQRRAGLVIEMPTGNWRAPRGNQVNRMRKAELVRVPERFHGLV